MKQPSSPPPDTSRLSPHTALVIFAKAPIPGEVKTRLCPPLTPDEAATLHGSFVLDMLERTKLAVAKLQLPLHRYLACAPSSALVFFKIMEERQGVRLLDQVGKDLGQRMHHTCVDLFTKGYKQVIIVGTDVPTLPLSVYQEAFAMLGRSDVVLGPALDGGYYLIGLAQPAEKPLPECPGLPIKYSPSHSSRPRHWVCLSDSPPPGATSIRSQTCNHSSQSAKRTIRNPNKTGASPCEQLVHCNCSRPDSRLDKPHDRQH